MNEKEYQALYAIARDGICHAVGGLSDMIGEAINASDPELDSVPILQLPNLVGGPEMEAVGVYLTASGEAAGQFMLILPIAKALELIDVLMDEPVGTTKELEGMGKSALAEVGNLTGAFFLNQVSKITGMQSMISPPAVIFDMVGAVLNIIIATSAETVDEVFMIRTNLVLRQRDAEVYFWYVPNPMTIERLIQSSTTG